MMVTRQLLIVSTINLLPMNRTRHQTQYGSVWNPPVLQKANDFLIDKFQFIPNRYDHCMVNKEINGSQCTIGWQVN